MIPITDNEQEQAQSLWLLNTLLKNAPVGFVFLDRDLRIIRINDQLAEINGLPVAAHLGRTVAEILPTLEPTLREVTERILATGEAVCNQEFAGQTKKEHGYTRYWNESWYPVRNQTGEIIGFGGVVEEITERKLAESKRIETERNYSALIEASFDATYRMSADWSTRMTIDGSQLFSTSQQTLGAWEWMVDTIPPNEHAPVRQAISDAIAGKKLFELEHRVLRADGSHGWVHSRAVPLLDENKVVSTWFGTASDITDRKYAEQARHKSDERLRYALHAAEAGAWDWDITSGEINWSPETYVLYDVDPGSASPRYEDWDARLHPGDRDRVNEQVRAVLDGRSAEFRTEFRIVSRQGAVRWLLGLGQVERNPDGQAVRMSGINLDITERKLIELKLIEATAVAENANREKSKFLSRMSHEMRTPLNSVIGFAQLLESDSSAPTPTQRRYLEQILKGGWYLRDLINDLLDLAQIESGKLSLTQERVSLTEVMMECQNMIEPLARKHGINITYPSAGPLGYVRADFTRVKQVVINLLSNAIKYNKAQGTVTVECALSLPNAIRISIRDTGEGMAPEMIAQLFQPFNRLGKEGGPEQGTGIGLVMGRCLVEMMGGAIGVDSTVGVGSMFWFELPIDAEC